MPFKQKQPWYSTLPPDVQEKFALAAQKQKQMDLDTLDRVHEIKKLQEEADALLLEKASQLSGLPISQIDCGCNKCPGSLGICFYDNVNDHSQDDCLFCHEPRDSN